MYIVLIGSDRLHDYRPDTFASARSVACELSRDHRGERVRVFPIDGGPFLVEYISGNLSDFNPIA